MPPPYPPSFDNSPMLYAGALGSVTALACLMAMITGWMAREIWRDRRYVHPKTALTAFRVILLTAALTSFIRALPDAIYMYAWNEVDSETMRTILFFKRLADSMSIAPGAVWTVLLLLAYAPIANSLKTASAAQRVSTDLWAPWPHLVRPLFALVLIFVIAFLVAVSKLYLGVPLP
jgi:hypothetical protein